MTDTELVIKEPSTPQRDSRGRLLPGNTIGKPWVKGQSGNPNGGIKKDVCLSLLYKEEMAKLHGNTKLTREQIIAEKVAEYLADKDIDMVYLRLLELLQERTEGKVTLPIGGDDKLPLYVIHCTEGGKRNIERVMDGDGT